MCFFLVVVVIVFVLGHGLDVVVGVINVHGGWVGGPIFSVALPIVQ